MKNAQLAEKLKLLDFILEDLYPNATCLQQSLNQGNKDLNNWEKWEKILSTDLISFAPEILKKDITSFSIFGDSECSSNLLGKTPETHKENNGFQTFNLIAKSDGILSGIQIVNQICQLVDRRIKIKTFFKNGDKLEIKKPILSLTGPSSSILLCERVIINLLAHLSGIASKVFTIQSQLNPFNIKLLDTRKTIPGLRIWQKMAVKDGGGQNHRFGLFDELLVKDNHIDAAGGIEVTLNRILNFYSENKESLPKLIVEVRDLNEIKTALKFPQIDRLLLDNFDPELAKQAVTLINKKVQTEISGNIGIDNFLKYAKTGVNFISIGSGLTLEVKVVDFSLLK